MDDNEFWTTASETCLISGPAAPFEPEAGEITQSDIEQILAEV
jgi:hypothetical protein